MYRIKQSLEETSKNVTFSGTFASSHVLAENIQLSLFFLEVVKNIPKLRHFTTGHCWHLLLKRHHWLCN